MENIKVGDWVGIEISRSWRKESVVKGGRVISVDGDTLVIKVTTRRETGMPLVSNYTRKISELAPAPEKWMDVDGLVNLIREFDSRKGGVK